MVRFLPVVAMAAFAFAMMPQAGCGKGVFNEVTSPTPTPFPTTVPSATPTAAPIGTIFTMRGSSTQTGSEGGTCSGATCAGTGGNCQCTKFAGIALSSEGNLTWTADVTVFLDDCITTGYAGGFCCNGDGTFTATQGSGASASTLMMSFTGPDCIDVTNLYATSVSGTFAIAPGTSTGKFANSTGTGHFNMSSRASDGAGYIYGLGQILLGGK
ncbi:MAG TPA: hypothetical protein VMT64_08640 [Candidatus Binataceae bacterium]|nr:hypothetical protein [Candidatus Binataceae bacterium]